MHLGSARIEDHLLDLSRCGAAHHAVIHQNNAFASDQSAVDVQFEAHAHVADLLGGFDEGAAHILVADNAHGIGRAAFL